MATWACFSDWYVLATFLRWIPETLICNTFLCITFDLTVVYQKIRLVHIGGLFFFLRHNAILTCLYGGIICPVLMVGSGPLPYHGCGTLQIDQWSVSSWLSGLCLSYNKPDKTLLRSFIRALSLWSSYLYCPWACASGLSDNGVVPLLPLWLDSSWFHWWRWGWRASNSSAIDPARTATFLTHAIDESKCVNGRIVRSCGGTNKPRSAKSFDQHCNTK